MAANHAPQFSAQRRVDSLKRAVGLPLLEVVICRAFRHEIVWQCAVLAAGREEVGDRVPDLANIHLARGSAVLGRRNEGLDESPLFVGNIGGVDFARHRLVST